MQVIFSKVFKNDFLILDEIIQLAITDFVNHVEEKGLKGLKGRNKSSAIPSTTKKGMARYKHAQKHCLWHYHLGVPEYIEQANGELTSEIILHYCHYNDFIVLVD